MSSFDEEKESFCDWSDHGLSLDSDCDVPPPPATDQSDCSTVEEQSISSSSSSIYCNDDDTGNVTSLEHCGSALHDIVNVATLEPISAPSSFYIDCNDNLLESCAAVLRMFSLRCALDHWKYITGKETEKFKQKLIQQACLRFEQLLKRAKLKQTFLFWCEATLHIAWQDSALVVVRQWHVANVFRHSFAAWKDAAAASTMRRKKLFLMILFNRWRLYCDECKSKREMKYAALMHWAERLTMKSFSAWKLHADAQRDIYHQGNTYHQPRNFRCSSFWSPERTLVLRNSTPEISSRLMFINSARKSTDQGISWSSKEINAVMNGFRSSLQTSSSSFNRIRFHDVGSPYFTNRREVFFDEKKETNTEMSVRLQSTESSQPDCSIPYGYASDEIV